MSEQRHRGRILVIRGGAIGDFVLTLPVFNALRERFPQTHLEVLGYPHITQLAVAGGLADESRSIEAGALAGFFARSARLDAELADYFRHFNIIFSYLYDPDQIFRENMERCFSGQFIAGPHRPPESGRVHATAVFLQPLERLAIFTADSIPRLDIQPEGNAPAEQWIALHPGSGSELKNWPEEKWARLIEELINGSNLNLLLVGGEAEGDRLERLAASIPPQRLQLVRSLPLARLAASLKRCDAYLGHDSGISHLAAAVGLDVLILWGATRPEVWAPPSPHVRLVKDAQGLKFVSVERVLREINRLLQVKSQRRPT